MKGLVDRIDLVTKSEGGKVIDHISIKCGSTVGSSPSAASNAMHIDRPGESNNRNRKTGEIDMSTVYEELRSSVLRIGLLDTQLPKLPEGKSYTNWCNCPTVKVSVLLVFLGITTKQLKYIFCCCNILTDCTWSAMVITNASNTSDASRSASLLYAIDLTPLVNLILLLFLSQVTVCCRQH